MFIVRVRNDDGSVAEGVRIADCGIKAALNGIDSTAVVYQLTDMPLALTFHSYRWPLLVRQKGNDAVLRLMYQSLTACPDRAT